MKFLFLLLALTSSAAANDTVVIVLDSSGSMDRQMAGGRRIDVAKRELLKAVEKMPQSKHVGIITFEQWIYPIGPIDKVKIRAAVNGVQVGGGTPIYEFLSRSATTLLQQREKNQNLGAYKILLLTDGEAGDTHLNRDAGNKKGVLNDILSRGIVVDCIGLDLENNGDYSLKDKINGSYMRGDDPKSLQRGLEKSLVAEIGFSNSKDTDADAFEVISVLPDNFVRASLKGLTEFPNQEIGKVVEIEQAPVQPQVVDQLAIVTPVVNTGTPWFLILLVGVASCVITGMFLVMKS